MDDPVCICGEPWSEHDQIPPCKCLFCDECEGFVEERKAKEHDNGEQT